MKSFIAALRSLVLPFGTTASTRIVLDGVNGRILLYDAADDLVAALSPAAGTVGGEAYVKGATFKRDAIVSLESTIPGVSIVLDPNSGTFTLPTIYLNRGGDYAFINSPTDGTIEVSGSYETGPTRARMRTEIGDGKLEIVTVPGDVLQGGRLHITGSAGYLSDWQAGVCQAEFGIVSHAPHTFPSFDVLGAGGAGRGPMTADTGDYAGAVNLSDGHNALSGDSSSEVQSVKFGSSVLTTNGSGQATINPGFTTLRGFVAWNGDGAARANMVIANNRGLWPVSGSQSVGVTCWVGNTGATINSVAVRVDWLAYGVL